MKKLLLAAAAAVTFYLLSCSTDFDVTGPWKNIPVVYGILSVTDTAQYVRVEKAFLDPDQDATQLAQIPDSLYYPENDIAVFLQRPGSPKVALQRVDGNAEGYFREGGIFATSPNWLYKLPVNAFKIEAGQNYQLLITRTDGDTLATSSTTVPGNFRFRQPLTTVSVIRLSFLPNSDTRFEWSSDGNAEYFNLRVFVRIREENETGTFLGDTVLVWNAGTRIERSQTPSAQPGLFNTNIATPGITFYQFLANSLSVSSTRKRVLNSFTLELQGGGKELRDLYQALSANSGITGAEYIPAFTNINGGYGVFTSKNTLTLPNVFPTDLTLDSLSIHPLTKNLNFK